MLSRLKRSYTKARITLLNMRYNFQSAYNHYPQDESDREYSYPMAAKLGRYLKALPLVHLISDLLLGDLPKMFNGTFEIDLADKAIADKNGIGHSRIGPVHFGTTLAIVYPVAGRLTGDQTNGQLKYLMNLKNPNARETYKIYNRLTRSSFFLSSNDAAGKAFRRKFSRFITQQKINEVIDETIKQLFRDLVTGATQPPTEQPPEKLVKGNVNHLFEKLLIGYEMPQALRDLVLEIDSASKQLGIQPVLIQKIWPSSRHLTNRLSKQYDEMVKNLLNNIITWIKEEAAEQAKNLVKEEKADHSHNGEKTDNHPAAKSLLTEMLLEKAKLHFNKSDLLTLNKSEVLKLAEDSDVRFCFAIYVATNNIVVAIWTGVKVLDRPSFKTLLAAEIDRCSDYLAQDPLFSRNQADMPHLHSLYLEALWHTTKELGLVRYTDEAISAPNIEIPRKSLISLPVVAGLRKHPRLYDDPDRFIPERFLDKDGSLCADIQLHEGGFSPFGLGPLQCPAVNIAEIVFKKYMIEIVSNMPRLLQEMQINGALQPPDYTKNGVCFFNKKTDIPDIFFEPEAAQQYTELRR